MYLFLSFVSAFD